MNNRRFIESEVFGNLVREIDAKAYDEKESANPPYWEMVFWWTRKPLVTARSFIAAALLPENYDPRDFKYKTCLNEETPHECNPKFKDEFKDVTLLDPFAGFGSIPLEAKRLGVGKVIASELLPTATFLLRAVLEYPKFGQKLVRDVERYGQLLIDRIRNYAREWYDASGYVGSWEVKCPHCGRYTPLVKQWWLFALPKGSKRKDESEEEEEGVKSGSFSRLVYMEPVVEGNTLRIRVRDLNKELGKEAIKVKKTKTSVKVDGKEYRIPEGNVDAKRSIARCLYCNSTFPGKKDKWYVKEAIKDWNDKYEKFVNGEITLEELKNAKARPRLLAKFYGEGKNLTFEEVSQQDEEKFWRAFEELRKVDISLIPTEDLPPYGVIRVTTWGMDKFFKLFNPRQLLVISHIIENLKHLRNEIEGDDEYKDAILTYLTIVLLNHIRYNSLINSINYSWTFIRDTLSFRRLSFTWNWADLSPVHDIIGSLKKSLEHVLEGLEYLVNTNGTNTKLEIINSDVVELELDKVDAIVTDPPYANDVPYAEVSDLYYVWIKRVFPFPYETQWKALIPKDIGVDEARKKYFGGNIGTYDYFRERLALAFQKLYEILKDDGVLVTFYNHTSPEAWVSLLYAGWYKAK